MERTVIISAPSVPPGDSPLGNDEDLAATMIQNAPGPPPSPSGGFDGDVEATVVINTDSHPATQKEAPPGDDDLDATMIITPAGHHPTVNHSAVTPSGPADDELAATLVETPRSANHSRSERPLTTVAPPSPPAPPQPPHAAKESGPKADSPRVAPDQANDNDDIMEQTIIIRSDVKKE